MFWREEPRTARVAHRCIECEAWIRPGQPYFHFVSQVEPDPLDDTRPMRSVAICARCRDDWGQLERLFAKENLPLEICYGALQRVVQDAVMGGLLDSDATLARRWRLGRAEPEEGDAGCRSFAKSSAQLALF